MLTDLLCYQAAGNDVEYRRAFQDAATREETWPPPNDWWSHIVPIQIGAQGILSQLVLYNLFSGTVQIATIEATPDGSSLTVFAAPQVGWRPGWTQVIPVPSYTGTLLLFYDATQGTASFYSLNGLSLLLVSSFTTRTSWRTIIPGDFGGDSVTDLLFYDPIAATGVFYSVDAGSLNPIPFRSDINWRTGWSIIVAGKFGGDGLSDLMFYDADSGTGEFYTVSQAGMKLLSSKNDWNHSWQIILPGNFSGSSTTDLFFYSPSTQTAQFYSTSNGHLATSLGYFTDWRNSWNTIAAGTFLGNIVPNVFGQGKMEAQNNAVGAGLAYYFTGSNSESAVVTAQKPDAGQIVNAGDAILMTMG